MKDERAEGWSRRHFIRGLTLAGTAGLVGLRPSRADADPPPETTKLKLLVGPATGIAPLWAAQELLVSEGFSDLQYVKIGTDTKAWAPEAFLSGEADLGLAFVPSDILHIDAGAPLVILAGSHIGCVELVGSSRIRSAHDLKGKTVAVERLRSDEQTFVSLFAAHVGLDSQKEVNWVVDPSRDHARLLTEGKIDAFITRPPWSLELRAKKIGHVLVSTTTDKPWSHYFCCLVTSTREFVRTHPVATKRAVRAIVKAADVCAVEPHRVARLISDTGLARYDNALQTLQEIPYGKWREHDPEDAVRFFALRMRDVGMIKSSPQKIIAEGTDWRFLNELKRELKG